VAYLGRLKKETDALEKSIIEIVVYSQGSVTLSEIWYMSSPQRELFAKTFMNFMKQKAGKSVTEEL
tara:strand:+ start:487 stop:684 length:198 start_codon:yes stop_codon:yes gene_type:complete